MFIRIKCYINISYLIRSISYFI